MSTHTPRDGAQRMQEFHFSRRSLIGFGAAGIGAALLTAGAKGDIPGSYNRMWDTIVVGAGPAGLGAARRLADAGKRVLVLEARDRIGGRMWTDTTSMSIPVERGAELVHGSDVSTWDLIDEAGLTTHRQMSAAGRLTPESPWIRATDFETFHFPKGAPAFPDGLPRPTASETAQQWLDRVGIGRDNLPISVAAIEVDSEQFDVLPARSAYGAVLEALDLQNYSGPLPPQEYGDYRVVGGYKQVLAPLSEDIPLALNAAVTRVQYRKNRVDLDTAAGKFKAKSVIMAVPGGVLKHGDIAFDPPLPAERQAAIQEISYLPVFKGLFEFDRPVLPAAHPSAPNWDVLATFSQNPPSLWNGSAGTPGFGGEIVVSWMTGAKAQQLLDVPEQQRLATALESIRLSAGDATLTPVHASTYDWSKDRFARGAYPGPFSRRTGLTDPIGGVLFWAGMVTSTVHASRDSGTKAATAVLASGI